MKRFIENQLLDWRNRRSRKPLLLIGARQVGKTHSLEEFGKKHFAEHHLFDFSRDPQLGSFFEGKLEARELLRQLSLYSGKDINPKQDLVVLDEIQHSPRALTSLKYFEKELPSSFICGSGSLLGISFANDPFPVGKVERLELFPLNFTEFLIAMGEASLAEALYLKERKPFENEAIHEKVWRFLSYYFTVGGMPEVVKTFADNFEQIASAFNLARQVQKNLIQDYKDDFSKYAGKENASHLRSVFEQVPNQLSRKSTGVDRFQFKGTISDHSSYRELEGPLEWLSSANLILKVPICETVERPMSASVNPRRFKLYHFDVGLLGAMLKIPPENFVLASSYTYKGFLAENFALQELYASGQNDVFCWSKGKAEIEFILEDRNSSGAIPIEIKSGLNSKAKSLKAYRDRYAPEEAYLFSANKVLDSKSGQHFLPLYMIGSEFL